MTIRWYKAIPFVISLAVAFTLSFVQVDDADVWWHLKCGEMFLKDLVIPRTEIFSYTAAGAPWVDGYLPAQVMLWLAWRAAGPAGVGLLGALLVTGMYALSLLISRRKGAGLGVALAVYLPALFLARAVMLPRPALLTPIFALLTMWLMEDFRLRGGWRVWWVVPISALWANCHPAFWLGPIITAIYIAGALLTKGATLSTAPGRTRGSPLRILGAILPGQLLATLINPYGYRIYYSAFSLFLNPQLRDIILEWKPLYGEPEVPIGTIECFLIMIAVWVAVMLRAGRRTRIEHALLFVFITLSTVFGRRNLVMFGPLSIPLIAWTAAASTGACSYAPLQWAGLRNAMVKAGAALITLAGLFSVWFTATNRLYFYTDSYRSTGVGIQKAVFPEGAVALLNSEHIEGNLFHNYNLGGYLIFKLYPKYKVFIDGRIFPYPYELSQQEDLALVSSMAFNELQSRYDIRAVLLPISSDTTWQMIYGLMQSPDWAAVQADEAGALFLRRGSNEAVIKRHEIDLLKDIPSFSTPPTGREFHWWSRAEYPAGPIFWTEFYEKNGQPDLAARALKPALDYRPVRRELEAWYGYLLIKAGKLDEGMPIIRRELEKEPGSVVALCGLAAYHIKKGEYGEAEEIYIRVTRRDPKKADVWNTLGDLAFNRQDYGTAAYYFGKATTLKPEEGKYWERLGMSRKYFDTPGALDAYMRALDSFRKSGGDAQDIERIQERLNKLPQ